MKSISNHLQTEQQSRISNAPPRLEPDYRGHDLIFIISQPRAGSTLLQRLISGHADIHATAEPWLMLHPLYALKNSGIHTEYRASLARHALQDFLAQFPDGESVYIQSLRRQAAFLYQSALKLAGKRYFLDKTPRYYHILPDLHRVFPDAKFILLFRNPLAVFSSTLKTWLNNDLSLIDPATRQDLYEAPQKLIDGARGLKENAIVVNYEQLVMQPLAELKRLFVRLKLVFQDDLLEYGSRTPPAGRFGDSENVQRHARPVSTYINKWMVNLNEPDLVEAAESLLAHIGEDTIVQMGYSFTELQKKIETLKKGLVPDRPISQNASEFLLKGTQLMAANKIEEAAITYMKLIEENPMNPEALLGMAHVSLASGRPSDAVAFCAQVKKIAPQIPGLESMLAKIDQIATRSSVTSERNLRARIRDNGGQEQLAESENRIPVLIYQMGKVGSTTIRDSLDAHQIYNQHAHRLSWEGIRQAEERYQRIRSGQIPEHIVRYRALREFIDRTPTDTRWQIITLVRDPIARLISSVFQNLDVIFPEVERFNDSHLPHIEQHILEQLHRIKKGENGDDSVWFDDELKHVFGFDIFKETFDSQEGYCIYHHAKVDVLAIRMEQLTACGSQAISAFLALKDFKLINANQSHKKSYYAIYRKLLASINIPEDVLDCVYTSRLAEHFYSVSEIESFKKRWRQNSIPQTHGWTDRSPRVSAIVSTYNSQRFIKGRLQNLIEQSLFRKGQLEIIVIDSNSTEDEGAVVNSYRDNYPQIKYIRTPVRETVYAAWNRGIEASNGAYFVNANTDDRFAVDALETMADELDSQSEYDVVYGNWLVTQTPNDTFESEAPKRLFAYPEFHPGLFFYLQITSHANFIRRKVFEHIGLFDEAYTVFGDREFMLRFSSKGYKALKVDKTVGLYLENPNSVERTNKNIGMKECVALYNHYQEPRHFANLMGMENGWSNRTLSKAYTKVGCFGMGLYHIDGQSMHALGSPARLFAKAIELDLTNVAALNNMGVVAHYRQAGVDALPFLKTARALARGKQCQIIEQNLIQIRKNAVPNGEPLKFIYPEGYHAPRVIEKVFNRTTTALGATRKSSGKEVNTRISKKNRKAATKRRGRRLAAKSRKNRKDEKMLSQARRFYLQEDFQSASKVLTNIITANSDHWDAYHLFVDLIQQCKHPSEAAENLKRLENQPDLPSDVLGSIGIAYEAAGELDQAGRFAAAALKKDDLCARGWNLQGVIKYRHGDFDSAAHHFQKASACDPSWGDPWTNLGTILWEEKAFDKALNCYEKGLELSPISPNIATVYHTAISETGQYERARPMFEPVVKRYPDFRRGRFLLIDILIRLEAYQDALTQIEETIVRFGADRPFLEAAKAVRAKIGPQTIRTTNHPSLSLCMIVKNEEKYIARCLKSLKPIVDEMIVVDTGSHDTTPDIAEVFGAKLYDYAWHDDFAEARNYSLSQASGDWILIMDADEVVASKDHKRFKNFIKKKVKPGCAYSVVTRNYTLSYSHIGLVNNQGQYGQEETGAGWIPSEKVRLFPNEKEIRFDYPVHELVTPSLERQRNKILKLNVPVHHYGKLDEQKTKQKGESYYRIGLRKLNEMGDDVISLRELAIQAALLGKNDEAERLWQRIIDIEPNHDRAHINLSSILGRLGKYRESKQAAVKAIEINPDQREAYLNHAIAELHLGNLSQALSILRALTRRYHEYHSAQFMCAAAEMCAGQAERGKDRIWAIQNKHRGNLALPFKDVVVSLAEAGQLEMARKLAQAADALDYGDKVMLKTFESVLAQSDSVQPYSLAARM